MVRMLCFALLLTGVACGDVTTVNDNNDGGGDGDGDGDGDAGVDAGPSCVTSILFSGPNDLAIMQADGSGARDLTGGAGGFEASWSPDGTQIAFLGTRSGNVHVLLMDADGGNEEPVGTDVNGMSSLRWSPNGERLAYVLPVPGGPGTFIGELIAINPDGSGRVVLKSIDAVNTTGTITNNNLAWSPDGQRIAYSFFDGTETVLRVMDADGGNDEPLTTGEGREPNWSPDGATIAFRSGEDIFAIPAAGGAPINLTSNDPDPSPRLLGWTPSNQILYESADDVFVMNRSGSGRTNLTMTPNLAEIEAQLSPDESALLVTAVTIDNREDPNLYVGDADGANMVPFTSDSRSNNGQWQPCQ